MQAVVPLFAVALVSVSTADVSCQQGEPSIDTATTIAFTHVSVIPMTSEIVLEDLTVLVTNGRISALGPATEVGLPAGTEVVDGTGQFLIPGLSDMHAHLRWVEGQRPEDYLAQGVTVVRNMQGVPSHLAFRDQVRAGRIPGPIVFTAGPAIAGRRIDRRHTVPESESEARALVREHSSSGYDYIKVYSLLSREMYDAILDEARQVGIPVVGHVSDAVGVSHAIRAGQSTLEHMFGYFWELESETSDLRGQWEPRRLFHAVEIDDAKLSVLAKRTARAGVWNCPTLWRKSNYLTSPLAADAWNRPQLRTLGEENRRKLLKALFDAGAGLLTGTDDRAEIIHDELELFVDAGLTPFDALRASTYAAAEYLGALDQFGTIEVGKEANLVLLRASPLDDIGNTKTISGVIMRGRWMPAED